MSAAVLVRICLTSAGDGELPWCVRAFASITSAAAAEVNGADSLVPPKAWIGDGADGERKLLQNPWSMMAVLVEHKAQFRSPGATRSTVRPPWVITPED